MSEEPTAMRLAQRLGELANLEANELAECMDDAAAELRSLHDELKECQDQRRAAFRRIEELDRELDAMRAQQPLTDEQIQAIYDECDKKSDGGNEFMLMFARAIEAAHGIK